MEQLGFFKGKHVAIAGQIIALLCFHLFCMNIFH